MGKIKNNKQNTDINMEDLLELQIESQAEDIDTKDEFAEGTKVKIINTNDLHLRKYIGTIGICDNTIRYKKGVKKTKVIFDNNISAYFKNEFLEKVRDGNN